MSPIVIFCRKDTEALTFDESCLFWGFLTVWQIMKGQRAENTDYFFFFLSFSPSSVLWKSKEHRLISFFFFFLSLSAVYYERAKNTDSALCFSAVRKVHILKNMKKQISYGYVFTRTLHLSKKHHFTTSKLVLCDLVGWFVSSTPKSYEGTY